MQKSLRENVALDFLWWKSRRVKAVSWLCSIFFAGKGTRKGSIYRIQSRVQALLPAWYWKEQIWNAGTNECVCIFMQSLCQKQVRKGSNGSKALYHTSEVDFTGLVSLGVPDLSFSVLINSPALSLLAFLPRNCSSDSKSFTSVFMDLSKGCSQIPAYLQVKRYPYALTLLRLPCIFWLKQHIITEHALLCQYIFPSSFLGLVRCLLWSMKVHPWSTWMIFLSQPSK